MSEEQFILRLPPHLAQRLHDALQQKGAAGEEGLVLELNLEDNGREGTFTVGGQVLPAALLDLPCVVESFKTRDENHLVKSADIGQMIMVAEDVADIQAVVEGEHACRHGITPPMRDVRRRRFAKHKEFDKEALASMENNLFTKCKSYLSGGNAGAGAATAAGKGDDDGNVDEERDDDDALGGDDGGVDRMDLDNGSP